MFNPSCLAWRNADKEKDESPEGPWYIPAASASAVNRQVVRSFCFSHFPVGKTIANIFHRAMRLNCFIQETFINNDIV